ncbi:MAG: TetR/AcrR family transcriptional regulator [Sporichthyaceae bacterium]
MPRSLSRAPKVQPRRDALLAAAVEVVGREGLAGTTHRSVTEAAGVPLATASYYFSSIGELIAEALTQFVRGRAAEMEIPEIGPELAAMLSPADIAHSFAARVMELDEARRLAFYEVLVNAKRAPEMADLARESLATYRRSTQTGLRAVGGAMDDRSARAFVALAVGFGLLHLADPDADDEEQLFEGIRDLFLGQENAARDPEGVASRMARTGDVPKTEAAPASQA